MRQFKNNEEIIEKINSSNMKWLIFVDKKSLAKILLKEIKREKVIYICADNQGDEEVKEIIKGLVDEDKMKADVLIATTVLDVGINIKDPVNVVSYLTERNTFIQAVGRKRVKKGEKVDLYVPRYQKRNLMQWINKCERTMEVMDEMLIEYPQRQLANGSCTPLPVFVKEGRYGYNCLLYTYYSDYEEDWRKVFQEYSKESEEKIADGIFKHFLSWFGKEFEEERESSDRKLKQLVDNYINKIMTRQEYEQFATKLRPFDVRVDKREGRKGFATRGINMIFQHYNLGYKMEVNSKKEQYK